MKSTLIPMAAVALFATSALAATPTFSEADANSDGWVTPEEFAAAMPDATQDDFVAIDANGDGAISEEEMAAYTAAQGGDTSG